MVVVHGLHCFVAWGTFLAQGSNPQLCIGRWALYHRVTWETQDELQIQTEKKEFFASWSHHCPPSISLLLP